MKKVLFIISLFVVTGAICQPNNFVGGSHGKLVVFCGYDVNSVSNYFDTYLFENLGYSTAESGVPDKVTKFTHAFIKRVGSSNKKLIVTYNNKLDGDTIIISTCDITGKWDEVATIFIDYWETKMNLPELKGKAGIVKYTITDKITFNTNPNGTATIHIQKNE